MKRIFLDYAASTPLDERVLKAMRPYFWKRFGNAGSLHSFGQEAMAAIDEARETIAKAIRADFREIIFTGSATEANNLALRGAVRAARQISRETGRLSAPAAKSGLDSRPDGFPLRELSERKDQARRGSETFRSKIAEPPFRIIISSIEHESVLETAKDLEKEGVEVIYLPVNREGLINLRELKKSLNGRTILVSIMYVNNVIGTIQPIAEIAEIIRDFRNSKLQKPNSKQIPNSNDRNSKYWELGFGAWDLRAEYPLTHTDAAQAFHWFDCDTSKLGVDLMTLSAHKINGPKGIGALYIKNPKREILNYKQIQNSKLKIQNEKVSDFGFQISDLSQLVLPIVTGGGQEFGLRSGTENTPAIVGFGRAVELFSYSRELENKKMVKLRNYFWRNLKKIYPAAELNGPPIDSARRAPHILSVYFPGTLAEDLMIKLDRRGIAVSSGAACSARASRPSHVLEALGLPAERTCGSIRFSLGKPTTEGEVRETLRKLGRII